MGEAVRETVDRCERLIGGLLMLARSEAAAGHGEAVDVAALAGDCITDLRARANEAHVEVRDHLAPAWTRGEPALIERLVANLLDNGIHHNEPGGFLEVTTRVDDGRVVLHVINGGHRIDPAEAERDDTLNGWGRTMLVLSILGVGLTLFLLVGGVIYGVYRVIQVLPGFSAQALNSLSLSNLSSVIQNLVPAVAALGLSASLLVTRAWNAVQAFEVWVAVQLARFLGLRRRNVYAMIG